MIGQGDAAIRRRLCFAVASMALVVAACAAPVRPSDRTPRVVASAPASSPTAGPTATIASILGGGAPIERESLRGTLVYSSDADGNDDVFLLRLSDDRAVRLTSGSEKEFDPSLSADGRTIAYRRNPRSDSDAADIWVMNVDGTEKHNLTNDPAASNWAPTWTPDGRIAYSSMKGGHGVLELWTMAADGSDARRVSAGWCEYAAPSPDGSQFVCASAEGGRYDIVVVDAATGARRPLVSTPVTEFGPSWSPDGRWIVFGRDAGDAWRLVRIRPDGSGEGQVAEEGVFPTWGPDGRLVWSGPGGINVANADGSGRIALDHPASFISWVP